MPTYAEFARAYDVVRAYADRGLDLDEVRVETSVVEAQVTVREGVELYTYTGATIKGRDVKDGVLGERFAEVLSRRNGHLILHARANLDTRAITLFVGDAAVLAQHTQAFAYESDNGKETLHYLDRQPVKQPTAFDLFESDSQKGSLLARCILGGLVEPHVTMTPHIAAAVGLSMVEALQQPATFNVARRYERALQWSMRDDTQAEWALYVVGSLLRAQQQASASEREAFDEILQSPLWREFNTRYSGSLFQGVLHEHGLH